MRSLSTYIQEAFGEDMKNRIIKRFEHLMNIRFNWDTNEKQAVAEIVKIIDSMPVGSAFYFRNHILKKIKKEHWQLNNLAKTYNGIKVYEEVLAEWEEEILEEHFDHKAMDDYFDIPSHFFLSELKIKIADKQQEDTINEFEEELREAAASTTYLSSLNNYLRMAKTQRTKDFIRNVIDDLRRHGELE